MKRSRQGAKRVPVHPQGSRAQTGATQLDTYRTIFDNVNDAIIVRDLKTMKILDVNSKLCEMTGYTATEIPGLPTGWFSAKPLQNGKTIAEHYATAARGEPQLYEWQGRKKDGTLFWVEANLRKVTIGKRECLISVLREVTRRRQAEEELRQSREQFKEDERTIRALLDAVTDSMVLLDTERRIIALNETSARAIGKNPPDVIGTCIDDYFDAEVKATRKKYADSVFRTGKPVRYDFQRGGKYLEHCVYPIFDDQGKVTRLAGYARDVTVQRRAQQELEAKSRYLEETNSALKVLLNQRDRDRKEIEDRVLSNVKTLILPILHRLRDCGLNERASAFLDLLETHINEVISPFLKRLGAYDFTPREMEIIGLVREGRTAKEIARTLNVCKGAVDIYKHHIRKKLGINRLKTNLRAHLLSLANPNPPGRC